MKKTFYSSFLSLILLSSVTMLASSCADDPIATVSFTPVGNTVDGDVGGDGGSTSKSYTWNNSLTNAELNMDITAASGGSMNIVVSDADGTEVLNETLTVGVGDDSKTVCSATGTAGSWTVTVTLTDFNGDGSFSMDQGC